MQRHVRQGGLLPALEPEQPRTRSFMGGLNRSDDVATAPVRSVRDPSTPVCPLIPRLARQTRTAIAGASSVSADDAVERAKV